MVFGVVVCQIGGAWCPEYMELSLCDAVLDPIEAHVDGLRANLFAFAVCYGYSG